MRVLARARALRVGPLEARPLLPIGAAFALVGLGWGWIVHRIVAGGMPWSAPEAVAAAITGPVIGALAYPVYTRLRGRHLLWLAPLSLYLAAACYGGLEWLLELVLEGPQVLGRAGPEPVRVVYEGSAAAVEMVLMFWAGLTLTFYGPLLLAFALATHAALRWLVRRTVRGGGKGQHRAPARGRDRDR